MKIILAGTGSVSAVKIPKLALELNQFAEVRVVLSKAALHFVDLCQKYDPATWERWKSSVNVNFVVYTDEDEWWCYNEVGTDPVLHIELRKWADLLLIAPLSANSLAKVANGICDNLTTSIVRAWDLSKPILVAPAMNTLMWEHPFTEAHLAVIKSLGYQVIPPISKELACGDIGIGALATVDSIISAVKSALPDSARKEESPTWIIEEVTREKRSRWEYALTKLNLSESRIKKNSRVVALRDTATNVVHSYALLGKEGKLKQIANLSTRFMDKIFGKLNLQEILSQTQALGVS